LWNPISGGRILAQLLHCFLNKLQEYWKESVCDKVPFLLINRRMEIPINNYTNIEKRPLVGPAEIVIGYKMKNK